MVRNLPAIQKTQVPTLGWEDPLEKEMATHSSLLAWKPDKPGRLQFTGPQRAEHDYATHTHTPMHDKIHVIFFQALLVYLFRKE